MSDIELNPNEKRAIEMNRYFLKGYLFSMIRHELGTHLNVIMGRAEYMLKGEKKIQENMTRIIAQVEKIRALFHGIDETCGEEGDEISITDTGERLNRISLFLAPCFQKNRINIYTEVTPGIPWAEIPSSLFSQIVLNILLGCIISISEGGIITISTRFSKDICIEFSVSGCREVKNVVDLLSWTSMEEDGIPLLERTLTRMGGRLEFRPDSDTGTTLSIFLPARR